MKYYGNGYVYEVDYVFVCLIVTAFYLCIQWIISKKFEKIAFQKGYGKEVNSFHMCFWLGLVGYLYVIALPPLGVNMKEIKSKTYECPKCKGIVSYGTESCPFCNQVFDWK